ncbi:CapA family protein [Candidatus Nomurabacteria bacterium]|nr:CapA family protein [Candidatus Nomurabacteria bacterium]
MLKRQERENKISKSKNLMTPYKKLISHIVWTVLAFSIGIEISYLAIKGGTFAYATIYNKTQQLIKEDNTNNPQYIGMDDPLPLPQTKEVKEEISMISIGFVGDIIPGIDVSPDIFSEIISYTQKPDIMIGNLEGVATDHKYFKCKQNSLNCFSFNGDDNFINLLSEASFDVLNIANNHFNDHGGIGQEETLQKIYEAGIVPSGIKNEITYIKDKDLKIGIIGFSNYKWTTNMNNTNTVEKIIHEANENADIVIVIFHGGGEGEKYAHTGNETEWYLGENRGDLRSFSHNAIDAGADIVLGSGPHILRGMEWYNDKLIAYSLGNFASANKLSTIGSLKTSAMIEVRLHKDGSFISGIIFPFKIENYGIPRPDLEKTAIEAINELSKSDFGEQGVILSSDGEIQIK